MNINWYPGHMKKALREMEACVSQVDLAAEIVDARIPVASRNPDLAELTAGKPHMIVLNRTDLADPAATKAWADWFRARGNAVLETNAKTGAGINRFPAAVREVLKDQIARWREKGQVGREIRVMVCGIPNVGKSTFINRVAGRKSAVAEDRPGVTRSRQWITVDDGLVLMDTPGLLWPKLGREKVGMDLAFTGAIKDEVTDREELACRLAGILARNYPDALPARYGIVLPESFQDWELLELIGRRRGFLISGGEVDLSRAAAVLLDEYRAGKLGTFTLEFPGEALK